MPILDLHAGVSAGNTSALTIGGGVGATATIPAGDDASVYGIANQGKNATLMAWGVETIAADTLYETQLTNQDMADPLNGDWYNHGTTSVILATCNFINLTSANLRKIAVRQNTGAGLATPYTIDYVSSKGQSVNPKRVALKKVSPNITTFGVALTAQAWGSQAFAPTSPIKAGKYAILGAKARTFTDVALVRFTHGDFQGMHPGFPVVDSQLSAATSFAQLTDRSQIFQEQGTQFVYMSEVTGQPCCPVFTVGESTGLVVEALSVIADTPIISVCLARLD